MSTQKQFKRAIIGSVGFLTASICLANSESDHSVVQHDAHQHGQVVLNVVQEAKQLVIELEAPGADVVGFESLTGDKQQQQLIEKALATLKQPAQLFTLSAAANCKLQTASASHNFEQHSDAEHDEHDHEKHDEHKHDEHDHEKHDEHKHDEHDHDEHQESAEHGGFNALYFYECGQIDKLSSVKTNWFNLFSATESIKVQQLTDKGQNVHLLSRENPEINF